MRAMWISLVTALGIIVSSTPSLASQTTWSTRKQEPNPITGEQTCSTWTKGNLLKPMRAPYEDTTAVLAMYKLASGLEYPQLIFPNGFNLSEPSRTPLSLLVKWDRKVGRVTAAAHDDGISFLSPRRIIRRITKHQKLLMELPWYKQGATYFEFDLTGSKEALAELRRLCS